MSVKFSASIRLHNGKLASRKNMERIKCVSTRVCDNVIHPKIDRRTYRETYFIKHDKKKGYAFEEVTHGMGICGFQPSIKRLILCTLRFDYLTITLEDEPWQP